MATGGPRGPRHRGASFHSAVASGILFAAACPVRAVAVAWPVQLSLGRCGCPDSSGRRGGTGSPGGSPGGRPGGPPAGLHIHSALGKPPPRISFLGLARVGASVRGSIDAGYFSISGWSMRRHRLQAWAAEHASSGGLRQMSARDDDPARAAGSLRGIKCRAGMLLPMLTRAMASATVLRGCRRGRD